MEQQEIFKTTAEADTKHLLEKLNESEADALEGIAESNTRINRLQLEIQESKKKRETITEKLKQLKVADDSSWETISKEFVESIESLEDKNIFKTKTNEWFKNIKNVSSGLKVKMEKMVS